MLKLFAFFQSHVATLRDREEGQTMAEYGVVLGVITLAVVATFVLLGGEIKEAITGVINNLDGDPSGGNPTPPAPSS